MKCSQIATHDVFAVQASDSIDTAISLMEEHDIRHLPVVGGAGGVVGMLSDRDVLLAVGWRLESQRRVPGAPNQLAGPSRVEEIMSRPVQTLSANATPSEAARLMVEHRIGALPLINHGRMTALLSETDLLRTLRDRAFAEHSINELAQETVGQHLHARVITVKPRDGLSDVVRIFRDKHVRHVPVVVANFKGGEILIGIVSDRDVRRALGIAAVCDEAAQEAGRFQMDPSLVMEVMTTGVRTIEPSAALRSAIDDMLRHRIHALPVVLNGLLSGILTQTDVVRAVGLRGRAPP